MLKVLFLQLEAALAKGLKPGTVELLRAYFVSYSAQSIYSLSLSQNTGRRGSSAGLTRNLTTPLISKGSVVLPLGHPRTMRLSTTPADRRQKLSPCPAGLLGIAAPCTSSLQLYGQLCSAASLWKPPPFSVPSKGFPLKIMVTILIWQFKKRCTKCFP